jgi:predicted nucleotide-binding protein
MQPQIDSIDRAKIVLIMSETVSQIIKGIDELRSELTNILRANLSDEELRDLKVKTWAKRTYDLLKGWGFNSEAEEGFGRNSPIFMYEGVDYRAKMRDDRLRALRDDLSDHPEHYQNKLNSQAHATRPIAQAHKVFLGHGHDKLWARVHMYLRDELKVDVEAWETTPRAGFHSVDILKGLLNSCTFAVIIATGDDTTADGGLRARQNVVHEVGLFQGRIGFEKVAMLRQEGIEEFTNISGLQVIPFSTDRIEAAFYELGRMLKREGLTK